MSPRGADGRVPGDGRQYVERVPGARRARLTPAPDTATDEARPDEAGPDEARPDEARPDESTDALASGSTGANDERMRRDVPPHY